MGYYHNVTFASISLAKKALPVIQQIDNEADFAYEVPSYEGDGEMEIDFSSELLLTAEQTKIIQSLRPLRVNLDNPDV